jgi:hypothetical protein
MRALVTTAAAFLLLAGPVSDVDARPLKRHAKRYVPYALPYVARGPGYPQTDGWYVHDANKLPIGSANWWDQMVREGRARR